MWSSNNKYLAEKVCVDNYFLPPFENSGNRAECFTDVYTIIHSKTLRQNIILQVWASKHELVESNIIQNTIILILKNWTVYLQTSFFNVCTSLFF